MLASILLPLAEWDPENRARDCAFHIARKYRARVQALAVIDIKAFEIPVLGTADGFMPSVVSPPISESQALLDELGAVARERLDRFASLCAEQGLSCSTIVRTGIPGDAIARESLAHDLVIMSRTGYSRGARNSEKSVDPLVSSVIRGSIRPVMVAGKKPATGEIKCVMMAFDGSIHAARALSIVLELAAGSSVECILTTVASSLEAGQEILAPAETYLCNHGVIPIKKIIAGARASEQLCGIVAASEVDILVMGAYGHSPIREVFFGSTTERILSHCDATVILQS